MAKQTVREHMRPTTGRQVGSYSRRDPRGPKPRTPAPSAPAVLASHQVHAPNPGGMARGADASGGLG